MSTEVLDILLGAVFIGSLIYLTRNSSARLVLIFFLALYLVRVFLLKQGFFISADILGGIILVGSLGLILTYHKEIRHYFQRVSSMGSQKGKGLLNVFKEGNEAIYINEQVILKALEYLKQQKEGALIILENTNKALPFCSGGHSLQAEISTELLTSLFQKTSPLHDGAVLISGHLILKAGLILPLSKDASLNSKGTRHRAGAGLSELCDAWVYVLSEETGEVSKFVGGKTVMI